MVKPNEDPREENQREEDPSGEQIYVPTDSAENLVLAMLAISQKMSGTLPTKADFYDSLNQFDVEPTAEFLAQVHASFPELEI